MKQKYVCSASNNREINETLETIYFSDIIFSDWATGSTGWECLSEEEQ